MRLQGVQATLSLQRRGKRGRGARSQSPSRAAVQPGQTSAGEPKKSTPKVGSKYLSVRALVLCSKG